MDVLDLARFAVSRCAPTTQKSAVRITLGTHMDVAAEQDVVEHAHAVEQREDSGTVRAHAEVATVCGAMR